MHGAKNPTRRVYVSANPGAFELIEDFKADHGAGFDVHDDLKLTMFCKDENKEVTAKKANRSVVEMKQRMPKKQFLKVEREGRNKVIKEICEQTRRR